MKSGMTVKFVPNVEAEVGLKVDAESTGDAEVLDNTPSLQVIFDDETIQVPVSESKREELEDKIREKIEERR